MENFIKRIYQKKEDEDIHVQFRRFSKGVFEHRALLDISNGSKIKIKTSFEFAEELALKLAESIQGKTLVTGGIITTEDIRDSLGFDVKSMKQFQGVKTFEIESTLSKEEIFSLKEKFPHALLFLSFESPLGSLKCKVKSPKSGKPGKEDEKPKADFCTLYTSDKRFLEDYTFGAPPSFKKCFIEHTFAIEKIEVPQVYENDFKIAREKGIRVGKILRFMHIDGKEEMMEFSLRA